MVDYQKYCLESSNLTFDWRLTEGMEAKLKKDNPLPDDLREEEGMHWWKVQHQGSSFSCSAATLATGLLWYHIGKKSMNSPSGVHGEVKEEMLKMPSTRFLWQAAKEFDGEVVYPTTFLQNQPASLKACLRILRKYGCLSEEQFGMKEGFIAHKDLVNVNVGTVYLVASIRRISAYINLEPDVELDLTGQDKGDRFMNNIKFWLKNVGPVAIDVYLTPELLSADARSFEFAGDPSRKKGSHAFCIVGFKNGYFILRNTKGEDWGKDGHAHVTTDYLINVLKNGYGVIV